jgi:beclin 1-associated autophagy-related key regulator
VKISKVFNFLFSLGLLLEIEAKQSNNSKNKYTCKLCVSSKQRFFCKKCLSSGFFTFQKVNSEERFIDKQQKLTNVQAAQKTLNAEFTDKFKTYTKLENLRLSLTKYRNNNALLRDLVRDKKESIQKLQETKKENHDKNRSMRIILPKYEDKVNKLGDYVVLGIEKNDDLRKKSNEQNEKLRVLRRSNIDKLVKYIFPITAKESIIYQSDSESTASDEASRNESATKEYVIANGPSLSNQNYYFEYCKWLTYNKDSSNAGNNNESGMEIMTRKAYATIATLTYIVQLISALSFYLDVRLHHKMTCNDFCKVLLNEQQFRRKVSKLNYNVAYFLYAQRKSGGQSSSIMENVLQLLRDGKDENPIADGIDSTSFSLSFTDLNDDNISDDSDIDDDDDSAHSKETDWENVTNIPTIEVAHHSIAVPHESSAMSSTIMNNITNVANSLFWNRWNK